MVERSVVVDWLGRGGISHTSEAWLDALESAGLAPSLVTRAGRELHDLYPDAVAVGTGGALRAHLGVVAAAIEVIREREPQVVVVQGSLVPRSEMRVLAQARAVGAQSVLVAHESTLTRRVPGGGTVSMLGRRADAVVCHSHYVADAVAGMTGRHDVQVVPLPMPLGLLARWGAGRTLVPGTGPIALHFGNLHRSYKGTSTVLELARAGVPGWRFAVVGTGAPVGQGVISVEGFVSGADLAATVAASAVCLLPYRRASQSGAIVLAQSVGAVPLVSDAGGLSEQVADGVTGRLLPAGSPTSAWRQALEDLADPTLRRDLADAGLESATSNHESFQQWVRLLAGGAGTGSSRWPR